MADSEAITHQASPLGSEMEPGTPALDVGSKLPDTKEDDDDDSGSVHTTTTDDIFAKDLATIRQPQKIGQRELGLHCTLGLGWYGSAYDDYDIITVHGIRDDYKTAWIAPDGSWWVRQKLFESLPGRQLDYSYEVDQESLLYQPNGIRAHAERLVTEYAEIRKELEETEVDRPIIWICHDLGGTIVKEALSIAINNPAKYGKIAILTTGLIFLGTPHRFQSTGDLEDQIHKLILLPGPEIKYRVLPKVTNLASQVNMINERFLGTKILDRAASFNIFTQSVGDILAQRPTGDGTIGAVATDPTKQDNLQDPVNSFPRYAHSIGHSFEAIGRFPCADIDHVKLVQGDADSGWNLAVSGMFNVPGCIIEVNSRSIHLQAHLVSLAPPTRALGVPYDPVLPKPPIVKWIHTQEAYTRFDQTGTGPRLLHLYGDGNSLVDISEVSRLFYVDYDANLAIRDGSGKPENTVIYFEFDQWDSRYGDLSSMLTYLINVISGHFWTVLGRYIPEELGFLNVTRSWSLKDLYHLYSALRFFSRSVLRLTIFIGCFDQCPEDQRRWFLERVLEEQGYSDQTYRMILSTSTPGGLAVQSFPDEARVNLNDCPEVGGLGDRLAEELQLGVASLMGNRPIYEDFRPQLQKLFKECNDTPFLGHIILNWLGKNHRGKPNAELTGIIEKLFPLTAENIVQVFISSLSPRLEERVANVFNWVKHASELWSPDSLVEALTIYEFPNKEHCLDDVDTEGTMAEIEEALCGIITVKNCNVKFSHPSFYQVPEIGVEGSAEERAAKVNSILAETCLRYLQLKSTQEALDEFSSENLEGGPWETSLDAIVISHPRTSLAEYAVRFWPQHYKASGQFKPIQLVHDLFASKKARAAWEVCFWLFSNPFTRIQRHYISTLPVFAMLGLEDLVDDKAKSENDQPWFEKDCWLAITECVRAGNKEMVQKLLNRVRVDEEELQTALLWAAAQDNADILNMLIDKIPNLATFQWSEQVMSRAASAGQDGLIAAILLSGFNINELSSYWGASPAGIATWRNQFSTMEVLLNSESKPDLNLTDNRGCGPISNAVMRGDMGLIELLLQRGASIDTRYRDGRGLVQLAVGKGRYKVVDFLIKSGADFETGEQDNDALMYRRPPLVVAAHEGFLECVRVLLHHKADPNVECASGTALFNAVCENHLDVARLLLDHVPKPDMDVIPEGKPTLLICAISTSNTQLASLLIEHGAKLDFIEENTDGICKTPLSRACFEGNLQMVKLLLENKADVNYTGDVSAPPLFGALYGNRTEVAKYLLNNGADPMWTGFGGMGSLHAGHKDPGMIAELLKRAVPIDSHSIFGTALHMAAGNGKSSESVKVLLESDPKPHLEFALGDHGKIRKEIGCTPLQLACMYKAIKCVKLLLEAGANPNFRNKNGQNAVDILLDEAGDSGGADEILKLLLSKRYKAAVDQVDKGGQTWLHKIRWRTVPSTVRVMVEANTPLNVQDEQGHTPLAMAVWARNDGVAKYLIEQGAEVNVFGPGFGSILHIAVRMGYLSLVKLLVESGADLESVHREYGESLLYTAVGVRSSWRAEDLVRYLVDEAKVPIEKLGGEFGYPIIRAAHMAFADPTKVGILKFLIRRKAPLNSVDSQQRRAVHLACRSYSDEAIRALVEAGAKINVKDSFGRMPIHFAASAPGSSCTRYLLEKFQMDVNVLDHDNWTPLMWAARSGSENTIKQLVERNADVWVRSRTPGKQDEWSALKLANFAGRPESLKPRLEPKEHTMVNSNGQEEKWDEFFHKSKCGHEKTDFCSSCLVGIIGIQWKCLECTRDFSLCNKCCDISSDMHDRSHYLEAVEPMYDEDYKPSTGSSPIDSEFDLDSFDLDEED